MIVKAFWHLDTMGFANVKFDGKTTSLLPSRAHPEGVKVENSSKGDS